MNVYGIQNWFAAMIAKPPVLVKVAPFVPSVTNPLVLTKKQGVLE
jgi:hypothetical protein